MCVREHFLSAFTAPPPLLAWVLTGGGGPLHVSAGVPKFYRWLSERYPMVNQQLEHGAPTLDNLYLDMNGIIHNCTHANEGENVIKSGKDEDEMMLKIFAYIDSLFQMIKPRKVFFMAIDGSAPRAKMNQQRARRFRSACERSTARRRSPRRSAHPLSCI